MTASLYKSQQQASGLPAKSYGPSIPQYKENCAKVSPPRYEWHIVWKNIVLFFVLHFFGVIGLWKIVTVAKWQTNLFWYLYASLTTMGITAGVHRLWSHRSYKAKLPLRIFLMLCNTAMFQTDIYDWVRDHRVHHKFTDTDADPHNSRRGFFFSHIGWLLVKKHENVYQKGKTIDMSDIVADPVVRFQRKYYPEMVFFLCFALPSHIPWFFWGEGYFTAWYVTMFRYIFSLHYTWLVNSAAHIWGTKPYDRNINPTENMFVSSLAYGEGWHNYHHVFPWDYKAAELGNYRLNPTTAFLDFMAFIGQAYDLKTVSNDIVAKRVNRSGDGSWKNGTEIKEMLKVHDDHLSDKVVWGWNDRDMDEDDRKIAKVYNSINE